MPTYFFYSETPGCADAAPTETEMPDDETAVQEGGRAVAQMLADDLAEGCLFSESQLRVVSDDARVLAVISIHAKVERP